MRSQIELEWISAVVKVTTFLSSTPESRSMNKSMEEIRSFPRIQNVFDGRFWGVFQGSPRFSCTKYNRFKLDQAEENRDVSTQSALKRRGRKKSKNLDKKDYSFLGLASQEISNYWHETWNLITMAKYFTHSLSALPLGFWRTWGRKAVSKAWPIVARK